jgi:hypothetical protein
MTSASTQSVDAIELLVLNFNFFFQISNFLLLYMTISVHLLWMLIVYYQCRFSLMLIVFVASTCFPASGIIPAGILVST